MTARGWMLATCCAAGVVTAALPGVRGDAADPGVLSLNGTWLLTVTREPAEIARLDGFAERAFDEGPFRSIPVPSNWSLHGFEEPVYDRVTAGGEGFYRRHFRLPAPLGERRALLHFGGVWASAEVWLNGTNVGRHDSGFTSFAFDVTRELSEGENLLAIRVRQVTRDTLLDTNDDWSLPGIYRDVWLELMPRSLYLDRIEVATRFAKDFRDADLDLRAFVVQSEKGSRESAGGPFELRAVLTGPDGRETQRASFVGSVTGGRNGRDVPLTLHVASPAAWTAETPNLYDLRVDLMREGRIVHSRVDRVGFREVSTAGGVLRVNGQPVKLRGVCRHDEHPDVGRATRPEDWERDIRLMKAANINAVRTSHYPPAEGFLRLCDALGLYVIDEVPMGYGGDRLDDPSFAGAVLLRARETVSRDRNRPSVIIWSIGNEDPLTDLHLSVIRSVKGMDPTRPVLMPWRAETELPPEIDILAPHYTTAEQLGALAAHSDRPVVTTEYSHALGPEDFGGLQDRWRALTRHPAGAGGMIWLWADQGLKRPVAGRRVRDPRDLGYAVDTPDLIRHSDAGPGLVYDDRGVYGEDGIVDPDRTPQWDYWETRAVYAPVVVLDEELPDGSAGRVAVRLGNEYDFTDLDAFKIEWRLMAGEQETGRGETRLHAPPHTTATLEIPTASLREVDAGLARYVIIRVLRGDGSEVIERSVRLRKETPHPRPLERGPLSLVTTAKKVDVRVGDIQWSFDPTTGGLTLLQADGRTLITGAHLALWRPMTISERNVFRWRRPEVSWPPDIERYSTLVTRWKAVQHDGQVQIDVEAEHRLDDRNIIAATYRYVVDSDGSLSTEWTLSPRVEAPWLPEVGMAFVTSAELNRLRWQGLGPGEATPNKRAAARFGVFSAERGSGAGLGTKAGVEWVELAGKDAGIRVTGVPFVRDEPNASGGALRALSAVQGSFTKFAPPERPEWRLDVSPGVSFAGKIRIEAVHIR